MIYFEKSSKIKGREDTNMRPLDPNEHRQYWEVIGLDILLMLCVAVPVAAMVFIILHVYS